MRIQGVILAGGTGRRMGGTDKALLILGGRTLVSHCASRLSAQIARIAISANGDAARFADTGLDILPDDTPMGPLSGILAGMEWAASGGAEAVVSVAVDTPFFPTDLVARLQDAANVGPAIATCNGRAHPTFGLWPVALRSMLRAGLARGEAKLMGFAETVGATHVTFPAADPDPFWNLNTPEDLHLAERVMER